MNHSTSASWLVSPALAASAAFSSGAGFAAGVSCSATNAVAPSCVCLCITPLIVSPVAPIAHDTGHPCRPLAFFCPGKVFVHHQTLYIAIPSPSNHCPLTRITRNALHITHPAYCASYTSHTSLTSGICAPLGSGAPLPSLAERHTALQLAKTH